MSVAALVWAGCSSPGEAPAPLLHAAASEMHTGEQAYLEGRAVDAVPALAEAVRLYLAAGDLPDASRSLVNLALAQRGAGDLAAASASAARLRELAPAARQHLRDQGGSAGDADELAASADWLEAVLALDRDDLPTASRLVSSPTVRLPATSPWPGRWENLRAEIALREGRPAEALTHARAGQAACVASHDRAEEARAFGLAGSAQVALAQWADARASLLAAVRLEAALGGGARMARNLDLLATVADQLGEAEDAQLYRQRARAIASAHPR